MHTAIAKAAGCPPFLDVQTLLIQFCQRPNKKIFELLLNI
jgi:hypothetical protein